jgi:hypothetical protein
MDIKDVKTILHIPNIENYLKNVFELDLYEVGDKTIVYSIDLPNNHHIVIDIISKESLIFGRQELAEILSHYEIDFLQWVEYNDLGNVVASFMYRPLVEEFEKNY